MFRYNQFKEPKKRETNRLPPPSSYEEDALKEVNILIIQGTRYVKKAKPHSLKNQRGHGLFL